MVAKPIGIAILPICVLVKGQPDGTYWLNSASEPAVSNGHQVSTCEDVVYRAGQPFVLIAVRPVGGLHHLILMDRDGRTISEHPLKQGEQLGHARLADSGTLVVYDYFIPPPEQWLRGPAPRPPVLYKGGMRCVRWGGNTVWERFSEARTIEPPVCSPEGCVKQAASNRLLISRYGWECVQSVTLLDTRGKQIFAASFFPEHLPDQVFLTADGSTLLLTKASGEEPQTWAIDTQGRLLWETKGAYMVGEPTDNGFILVRIDVHNVRRLRNLLGAKSTHADAWRYWLDRLSGGTVEYAVVNPAGYPVWAGSWRFDDVQEPHPVPRDEMMDVSFYQTLASQSAQQPIGSRRTQVTVCWCFNKSRRLLVLDAPAGKRGHLVLSRVVGLPAARRGEHCELSRDGRLVAIYRVSRDGTHALLHVHLWDNSGKMLREVIVPKLPVDERGTVPYPSRVWFSPDGRYVTFWLDSGKWQGYCIVKGEPSQRAVQ